MKRALFGLAVLLALPYACAPVYRFPAPVPFAGSHFHNPYDNLTGTWQRANLHAHGRAWLGLTSGRHTSEQVVNRYRELGYSIAGVSNYHQIAAHEGVPTLPLYEHGYNIGKHHQLAVGAHRVVWLDFPIWQSRSHLQFVINRVAAASDLVALVHPISRQAYTQADVRHLTGYHAIEVVNGKFPHDDVWDAALSSGHAVWGIGNDDNHDLDDRERLGVGWTMIDSPSSSTEDVVAALRAGRSYSVLRIDPRAGDTALGHVTMHGGTLTVRVSGAPATFEFIGQNGAVRKTVPDVLEASYTFDTADTYIRPKILAPRTTMYLNPVMRYDGAALPWPVAEIDPAKTWTVRAAFAAVLVVSLALYRRKRAAAAAVVVFFAATPAFAQTATPSPEPPMGASYDARLLDDLPLGDNLFALLETLQPSLISDRFSNGGLFTGQAARLGGFLASPTQTAWSIGGVDITDPAGGGIPMLFPDLPFWERVDVATGLFSSATNATGFGVTLQPRRPDPAWTGSARAAVSHFGSLGGTSPAAPPIAELDGWDRISALVSGPIARDRLGLVAAVSLTRGSQYTRDEAGSRTSTLGSAFTHLVFAPSATDEIRGVGAIQRTASPFAYRGPFGQPESSATQTSAHVQIAWHHQRPDAPLWELSGGYTRTRRTADVDLGSGAEFERLHDGRVEELAWLGPGVAAQWALGAAVGSGASLLGATHTARAGVDLGVAEVSTSDFVDGIVRERVDGRPARTWVFSHPGTGSRRGDVRIGVHASDRIDLGNRISADVGLRFESVSASAPGAALDVQWRTWMPRVRIRWTITDVWRTAVFAGYGRYAHRLPLDVLAIGDPAAPTAEAHRWDGSASAPTGAAPLVRIGPGAGPDPAFSRIDPELARPVGQELIVGFEVRPTDGLLLGLTGVARAEQHLLALVNVGAPASAYSTLSFADPGADVLSGHDDVIVTAYNRLPETFGRDRYLLTNPDQRDPTFNGLEITVRYTGARFLLFGGATAGIALVPAASRGFGPDENDHARPGELFTNPNAAPFARGRPFTDRAYTAKLGSVIRFTEALRLGIIARYQDGQPFARMLIVPGLNQGTEAVRAFANGDSRFTYTASLDLRLQRGFTLAGRRFDAVVDAYNVLNLAKEVEEITTSPPGVRITSAVQPPRAIHLGVRMALFR